MNAQLRFPDHRFFKMALLFAIAVMAAISLASLLHSGFNTAAPDWLAGGETTVSNRSSRGFSQPAANLSEKEVALHVEGDQAFGATFVTAPAPINAGLGPLFNNAACTACHIHDGRGMPVKGNLLVRVSLPPGHGMAIAPPPSAPGKQSHLPAASTTAAMSFGNAPPVPGLGTQIQDQAIYGIKPKATVDIIWLEKTATYGDGTAYHLQSPLLKITLPNHQALPSELLTSLRLPPPVFGRGLLEAIPEASVLALADPNDRNQDGISGKANRVWDVRQQALVLGRFGLKANNPNLLQQNAAAYVNDMGVTNPLFPEPNGSAEINLKTLEAVTFYTQTLAVPARTLTAEPIAQKGEKLFTQANCTACHIATLTTGNHPVSALAQQTIHPYTDLLVHDMGEGLADGRPDFAADGTEWRTAPLWGLGLTQTVLPYAGYLHDGRARTLEEAILWHGGEAERAKEAFRKMPLADRVALVKFLNSL